MTCAMQAHSQLTAVSDETERGHLQSEIGDLKGAVERTELEVKSLRDDENLLTFKDANEVLLIEEDELGRTGVEILREAVLNAEPYPVDGLYPLADFWSEILAYYRGEDESQLPFSTGWRSLDPYYKVQILYRTILLKHRVESSVLHLSQVVPGELTIVTGVPNSGKSEWIDALLVQLSHLHGWTFALCSMEKKASKFIHLC